MRLAHFLQTTVTFIDGQLFELLSRCFSSIPPNFQLKKWPFEAGIREAILNFTYEIRRNTDSVLGLAEKWCSLENLIIYGFSDSQCWVGSPAFIASYSEELKKREERLNQARISTRNVEHCLWMKKFINTGSIIKVCISNLQLHSYTMCFSYYTIFS